MGNARKIMGVLAVGTVTFVLFWAGVIPGVRMLVEADAADRLLIEQKYRATLICHDGDTVVCSREYRDRCIAWRICMPGKTGFF